MAAAEVEASGVAVVSGKQSTTTTVNKTQYSAAAWAAYRAGSKVGRVIGNVLGASLWLVMLILAAACAWYLFIGAAHLLVGAAHLLGRWPWPRPYDPIEYTVAIAAVSGLDPAKDLLAHPASAPFRRLDPAFNLTLGAASPSTALRRECLPAGTAVEVTYLRSGVPLAAGPTPALCVDAGERREETSVVAWGDGVRLPAFVVDSLAADVRRGAVEFGVKLTPPVPYCASRPWLFFSTAVDVISCWAKAGGGPAPCRVSRETVSFSSRARPGRDRDDSEANLAQPTQERSDI